MIINLDWVLNKSQLIQRTRKTNYEVFHILVIDKKGKIKPLYTVDNNNNGRVNHVAPPKDLTSLKKKYDEADAIAAIWVHNHPRGYFDTFTVDDIATFNKYREAYREKGMNLLDLLVVSEKTHYSLYQLQYI